MMPIRPYVEKLSGHGAELLRNQLVERIEVLGENRFVVHTGRGLHLEGRSVISNVDVAHTVEMLDGARPNLLTRRKVRHLRPSLGSFCLFIGTDLDLEAAGMTDANIWHYGTHDLESGYNAVFENRMGDNPFFFLTVPTLKDPDSVRAPHGHHTVELITFMPAAPFKTWFDRPTMKRGPAYRAIKDEIAARMLEAAEKYIPGLRNHVVIQESATPATVWHYVRGGDGGIYGPEHSPEQSFPRRFFTGIGVPGLYLAGASVLGAGILPCMSSGFLAARACAKHLRQKKLMRFPIRAQLRATV